MGQRDGQKSGGENGGRQNNRWLDKKIGFEKRCFHKEGSRKKGAAMIYDRLIQYQPREKALR
jgi:hypothetical protein